MKKMKSQAQINTLRNQIFGSPEDQLLDDIEQLTNALQASITVMSEIQGLKRDAVEKVELIEQALKNSAALQLKLNRCKKQLEKLGAYSLIDKVVNQSIFVSANATPAAMQQALNGFLETTVEDINAAIRSGDGSRTTTDYQRVISVYEEVKTTLTHWLSQHAEPLANTAMMQQNLDMVVHCLLDLYADQAQHLEQKQAYSDAVLAYQRQSALQLESMKGREVTIADWVYLRTIHYNIAVVLQNTAEIGSATFESQINQCKQAINQARLLNQKIKGFDAIAQDTQEVQSFSNDLQLFERENSEKTTKHQQLCGQKTGEETFHPNSFFEVKNPAWDKKENRPLNCQTSTLTGKRCEKPKTYLSPFKKQKADFPTLNMRNG